MVPFSASKRGTFGFDKPVSDIYLINIDGSELTQLTRNSGMNGSPNWSPDGKQIAFVSSRNSFPQSKIWLMNADGSNQRLLPNPQNTTSAGVLGGQPVWSPDGTKILFSGYRICGGAEALGLFVVYAVGSNRSMYTNDMTCYGDHATPR